MHERVRAHTRSLVLPLSFSLSLIHTNTLSHTHTHTHTYTHTHTHTHIRTHARTLTQRLAYTQAAAFVDMNIPSLQEKIRAKNAQVLAATKTKPVLSDLILVLQLPAMDHRFLFGRNIWLF